MRIVTEYVTLKQQEKDKLDMLRAFAGDSTSPLHRTVTSLVTLLDDYRTARQAGIPLNANPLSRTVASALPQHQPHPVPVPEPSVVSHARVASPAPPPHMPVSPRGIPQPSTPSRVASTIPSAPALPAPSAASGPIVPRRKAFRPRKIVLPVQPPLEAAPPLPAAAEAPSDAGIAFVLRDSELQQKLAERITHHIATDHPIVAETLEPQPSEVLESILASLHEDPDMAHLFGA